MSNVNIDKYAIKIAQSNYPDIMEIGDAYQLREDDLSLEKVIKNKEKEDGTTTIRKKNEN